MATAYWNNRAILRQAAYDRANNHTVATVSKAFDRAMNQLDIDIDKIMATYTRKTGLTARDAYQFLRDGVPDGVMDDLRARAAAITDKTQAKRLGVMLRTDAYRARISRLDAIKASTRVGLSEAAEAELGAITPHLRHTADLAYTRTMFDIQKVTAGFQMVGVPSRALDTILKSKWSGMNYAQSVWANRDAMAGILDRALMEQASMGKLSQITFDNVRGIVDTKAWADKVAAGMKSKFRDEMQYSKYAANRLIRTESAYVAGQTTAVAYDECEIEKYEFMATLDNRTSSICSSKDGEIYVTKDKEVGVNWPPLHPHCRSTTAPYIDGLVRENMTRAARDKDGKSVYVPRDMKYQEWKRWQDDGAPDLDEWRGKNAPVATKTRASMLDEAKDTAGVESLLKEQGWFKVRPDGYDYNTHLSLTGADVESAKEIYRAYDEVFTKYPQLKGKFAGVKIGHISSVAECYLGTGEITASRGYFENIKFAASHVASNGIMIANNYKEIIIHEIGHAIDGYYTHEVHPFGYNPKTFAPISASEAIRKEVLKSLGLNKSDIYSGVSEYATKNDFETMAECFLEGMCRENPRPIASGFMEIINKLLGEMK